MIITQTVTIPENHRLVIDVPPEVPAGPVVLTFTPETVPMEKTIKPLASLRGIHKGLDTMDAYFARKRADKAKEDAQIEKRLGIDIAPKSKGQ